MQIYSIIYRLCSDDTLILLICYACGMVSKPWNRVNGYTFHRRQRHLHRDYYYLPIPNLPQRILEICKVSIKHSEIKSSKNSVQLYLKYMQIKLWTFFVCSWSQFVACCTYLSCSFIVKSNIPRDREIFWFIFYFMAVIEPIKIQ